MLLCLFGVCISISASARSIESIETIESINWYDLEILFDDIERTFDEGFQFNSYMEYVEFFNTKLRIFDDLVTYLIQLGYEDELPEGVIEFIESPLYSYSLNVDEKEYPTILLEDLLCSGKDLFIVPEALDHFVMRALSIGREFSHDEYFELTSKITFHNIIKNVVYDLPSEDDYYICQGEYSSQ